MILYNLFLCNLFVESGGILNGVSFFSGKKRGHPGERMTGLDKIKEWFPSSRKPATVHRTVAFNGFSSCQHLPKRKTGHRPVFLFGADDRTRTCTLARWNLNPMSLPIPPHPQILYYNSSFSMGCQRHVFGEKFRSLTTAGIYDIVTKRNNGSDDYVCKGSEHRDHRRRRRPYRYFCYVAGLDEDGNGRHFSGCRHFWLPLGAKAQL